MSDAHAMSDAHGLPHDAARSARRPPRLLVETWVVLSVSLGASAIWSALSLLRKLTAGTSLAQQTSSLNSSVTPDRPWLDLIYQLTGILLALAPLGLVVYLLATTPVPGSWRDALRTLGLQRDRILPEVLRGFAWAAVIGIPGLGLYFAAKALNLNTTVAAANLGAHWWTVPVLILSALHNALLEEILMLGYLTSRWEKCGWSARRIVTTSALIRGAYHLYQGFGGGLGNVVMGLIFGWGYTRRRRVLPFIVAHTVLDIVAFVGYTLAKNHLSWL